MQQNWEGAGGFRLKSEDKLRDSSEAGGVRIKLDGYRFFFSAGESETVPWR